MSRSTAGSAAIFALAISWGIISILVREVHLPALCLVFWRVALSGGAVALGLAASGRRAALRVPPWPVLALGVLLAGHWCFYFAAIRETSVASANLVTYANPILVALLAPFVLGERVGRTTVAALAASVVGVAVISIGGPGSGSGAVRPLGVAFGVGAAVSYAALLLGMKRWASGIEPVRAVVWQSLAAAVVLSPAAFAGDYGQLDFRQVMYVLLLGLVLTGLSGLIFMSALRWVPATSAGILAYMEPVSAAALAAALLGERVTPAVVAGGVLIVAAGIGVIVAGAARGPVSPEAQGLDSAPART